MNVLDVSPRVVFPPERGSSVRTYNLLRRLSEAHDIRQFSQCRPGREEGARGVAEVGITPRYTEHRYSDRVATAVTEIAVRSWVSAPVTSGLALRLARPALLRRLLAWADVVLVEFPWQFDHCRRVAPHARIVLATHNVEAAKFRSYARAAGRPLSTPLWLRAIDAAEARAVAGADLILTVSAADSAAFRERYGVAPERLVEIPNGADTTLHAPATAAARAEARRSLGLPSRPTVLYAGADIPPNRAGLEWVRRVARRTDQFTFLVVGEVGRALPREGNVVATGFVEDFAQCLAAADFAVCPVEFGGGTKIKLLESLASGLPTVVFPESLHGLEARAGEHVLVAERSVDGLLRSLERLAADRQLAARLGGAGRELIVAKYDWRPLAARLERELLRLVAKGRGSRRLEAPIDTRRDIPEDLLTDPSVDISSS